jgi:hypothetical protein
MFFPLFSAKGPQSATRTKLNFFRGIYNTRFVTTPTRRDILKPHTNALQSIHSSSALSSTQ